MSERYNISPEYKDIFEDDYEKGRESMKKEILDKLEEKLSGKGLPELIKIDIINEINKL